MILDRVLVNIENSDSDFFEKYKYDSNSSGDVSESGLLDTITTAIKKAFERFQEEHKLEVFVLLTNNEEIRALNKEQRDIDSATDVLSFPLLELWDGEGDIAPEDFNPETGRLMMGDIIISLERAKEQSIEYGHSFLRETAFLATHGAFHLMGYDHDVPERERLMFSSQESVLKEIGLER